MRTARRTIAFLALSFAVAGTTPAATGAPRVAQSDVWIGTVTVSYVRDYRAGNGSTSKEEDDLKATAGQAGTTTVQGKRHAHVEFPGACPSIYDELGAFSGPATPISVSVRANGKYDVSYPNPAIPVEISERKSCQPTETRQSTATILSNIVPITGTTANPDLVVGSLERTDNDCGAPTTCPVTRKASWNLRRQRAGSGGGGGGGGGGSGGGGGGGAPGAGCSRNVINGTPRNDKIDGTGRADLIRGQGGNDRLRGVGGNDCLYGQTSSDTLLGGLGNDILHGGSQIDRLNAGPGNDKVLSRDGQRETVVCGPGRDIAFVDRLDRVQGCETVRRSKT